MVVLRVMLSESEQRESKARTAVRDFAAILLRCAANLCHDAAPMEFFAYSTMEIS